MSKKFTPGPWKAVYYLAPAEMIEAPNGKYLAMRQDGTVADMRLMAAAPDLLRELEAAHWIIRYAMGLMTSEQKVAWGRLNASAGANGKNITRANEREALLARLDGGAA